MTPLAKAPRVTVRLACGLYEGMLLFGVLAGASLVYGIVLRPDGQSNWGAWFSAYLLVVMAGYFGWFWSKGETLAMATWHLRLQRRASPGVAPGWPRALLRFACSLLCFLPALLSIHWLGLAQERAALWLALAANIGVYALLARLHPGRQFLHDVLAGTEMVRAPRTIQRKPK